MRNSLKNSCLILLGVVIGVVGMLMLALYSVKRAGGRELLIPKLCGDLRIYKVPAPDKSLSEKSGIHRTVVIEKDGTHFLMIHQDSSDISKEMVFFNDKGVDIFRVSLDERYRKKMRSGLTFGLLDTDPAPNVERYYDFNLDGFFDLVIRFNEYSMLEEISAKIDGKWKLVDAFDTKQPIFEIEGKDYTIDYWMK